MPVTYYSVGAAAPGRAEEGRPAPLGPRPSGASQNGRAGGQHGPRKRAAELGRVQTRFLTRAAERGAASRTAVVPCLRAGGPSFSSLSSTA